MAALRNGDIGDGSGGDPVGGLYITDGASECQGQAVHFFAYTCVRMRVQAISRWPVSPSTASVRIICTVSQVLPLASAPRFRVLSFIYCILRSI